MKAEYHQELNPIVDEIDQNIKEEGDISPEFIELEFKHAYLKYCNNKAEFQAIESRSLLRPVVLNTLQNHRKMKVNARCDYPYFKQACNNLKALAGRTKAKVEEKYLLFVNWVQERFCYDCSLGKWMRVDKVQFFNRQYDIVSNRKLFRIDFCRRQEDQNVDELVKQLIATEEWFKNGYLRFKHCFIYHIDPLFSIECNTVYESQQGKDYLLVEKTYKQGGDFLTCIQQKIKEQEQNLKTKDQLQLKITPKGIQHLRTCSLLQMKVLVSRAFDQMRDISDPATEEDIVKMMNNLTIEQKKQQGKKEEKQERADRNAGKTEKREEARYVFRNRE